MDRLKWVYWPKMTLQVPCKEFTFIHIQRIRRAVAEVVEDDGREVAGQPLALKVKTRV